MVSPAPLSVSPSDSAGSEYPIASCPGPGPAPASGSPAPGLHQQGFLPLNSLLRLCCLCIAREHRAAAGLQQPENEAWSFQLKFRICGPQNLSPCLCVRLRRSLFLILSDAQSICVSETAPFLSPWLTPQAGSDHAVGHSLAGQDPASWLMDTTARVCPAAETTDPQRSRFQGCDC